MIKSTVILVIATVFAISAHGQGFLNLDFESAYNLPQNPGAGTLISITNGLPDWTEGTISEIYYVSNSLGREQGVELEGGSLALSGNFSVGLYQDSSISQTGLVPTNAESLEFEAYGPGNEPLPGPTGLSVTLGGQNLSCTVLSDGPDYDIYGANIPAGMAGQTEALSFLCQGTGSGQVRLDNIEFSTTGAPEPSEWALVGLAAVLVVIRRFHGFSRIKTLRK